VVWEGFGKTLEQKITLGIHNDSPRVSGARGPEGQGLDPGSLRTSVRSHQGGLQRQVLSM